MSKNLFEVASRKQYRFQHKGSLSVEDLWQLPLTELDSIFKVLKSKIKQSQEESLLENKTEEDVELNNKIEIVKHIVNVRLEELDNIEKAKQRSDKRQKIMSIIKQKEDEELFDKSSDELKELLEEL